MRHERVTRWMTFHLVFLLQRYVYLPVASGHVPLKKHPPPSILRFPLPLVIARRVSFCWARHPSLFPLGPGRYLFVSPGPELPGRSSFSLRFRLPSLILGSPVLGLRDEVFLSTAWFPGIVRPFSLFSSGRDPVFPSSRDFPRRRTALFPPEICADRPPGRSSFLFLKVVESFPPGFFLVSST